MKPRDLYRLPLGNYILTDGIYRYMMEKKQWEWGDKLPYYSVREYGSFNRGSFCFYEEFDNVRHGIFKDKQKILSTHVFVSGISFKSTEYYNQLQKLNFEPRSCYKEWLESLLENELQTT